MTLAPEDVIPEDAEPGPAIPGEGASDWQQVKDFFSRAVGALVVPPIKPLAVQHRVVDVRDRSVDR